MVTIRGRIKTLLISIAFQCPKKLPCEARELTIQYNAIEHLLILEDHLSDQNIGM